jgi:hypothetical protein
MNERRRLRIALLGETGGPGGAERMMLQLAEELRRRGHEVFPIGPERRTPWLRTQFRDRGFEAHTFMIRRGLDSWGLVQMIRLIRRLRVDVVHTHEFQTSVYGGVAAAGIACWFGFQSFQNIGMCLGIMPVTGVPLPLVSYGGSSMFATLMAIGLLQNIHLRTERSMGLGVARSRLVRSRF